jgi:hypothetical protein
MAPDIPSDNAILERALSLANEAVFTVELQRRRLRSQEPEDEHFVMRAWADAQLLIVMLRRLRRTAVLAMKVEDVKPQIKRALKQFDRTLPSLRTMRNVGEHIDEYAVDAGDDKNISPEQLQTGSWGGSALHWLGLELDFDRAMNAAEELVEAMRSAAP